jgi:hypothetical protein
MGDKGKCKHKNDTNEPQPLKILSENPIQKSYQKLCPMQVSILLVSKLKIDILSMEKRLAWQSLLPFFFFLPSMKSIWKLEK